MTRATDLPKEARAFLDALAFGESGGADDDAAYTIYFGGSHFTLLNHEPEWPVDFPQWHGVWIGGLPTHAAGRYQFEPATWRGLGGGSFDPVSQDHKAWQLARQNYIGGSGILLSDLVAQSVAIETLQPTWTSLSAATFPKRYAAALAKLP
jgi:muramidase (phage lysozyme)